MTDVNFPQDFYLDDVGVWRLKKEKLAELEKPKPMTNEEWIKSANTEQLAEWLARITNAGYLLALRMKYHCDDVDAVREWLKEKHD